MDKEIYTAVVYIGDTGRLESLRKYMLTQQSQLEGLLSMQGAEIRKFISDQIKDLVRVQNLDPAELAKTIDSIKTLIDGNLKDVKGIIDLVNGNKNAIDRASQELKDLIMKTNTDSVSALKLEMTKSMNEQNLALVTKIEELRQQNNFRTALDVPALFNAFAKSLWNYSDYICTRNITVGKGTYSTRFKLSADHFNASAVAFDIGIGSPEVEITIAGSVVYKDKVLSVKYLNQYEYITVLTETPVNECTVRFTNDAWEGGSDKNDDGISEDRNLHVFEITSNGKVIDQGLLKSGQVPAVMWSTGNQSYKW